MTTIPTRLKFRLLEKSIFVLRSRLPCATFGASEPLDVISARFHNTVVDAIVEMCRRIRASGSLKQVCLSGGIFQNIFLTERCVDIFEAAALRSSCTPRYRQMMAVLHWARQQLRTQFCNGEILMCLAIPGRVIGTIRARRECEWLECNLAGSCAKPVWNMSPMLR